MRFSLTFAEYSVVNAVRGLPRPVVAMLMTAKVSVPRTWIVDADRPALLALRDALSKEISIVGVGSVRIGAGLLSRVVTKIDELLAPDAVAPAAAASSREEKTG